MNNEIPNDVLVSVESAIDKLADASSSDAQYDIKQAMINLVMAERRRCYDLAHDVCEHDYDGVTGSLDDDIMSGVVFKKTEPVTPEELKTSIFSSIAYQKMFIEKIQGQFNKGLVSAAPSGVKDSTIKFMRNEPIG